MTNEEKYADEIKKIITEDHKRRPAVRNGKPTHCYGLNCHDCDLYKGQSYGCANAFEEWLKSEVEPEKEERMTNGEKYKDVIKRITRKHPSVHPAVINGNVVPCIGQNCAYCDLNTPPYDGCTDNYEKWLLEEADKPKRKKTPPRIIAYRDGDTVTVKDLETGETASAVCSKDDTFDFHTGAFIAMARLTHFMDDIRMMRLETEQIEEDIADMKMRFGALMGEGYKYPEGFFRKEKEG